MRKKLKFSNNNVIDTAIVVGISNSIILYGLYMPKVCFYK